MNTATQNNASTIVGAIDQDVLSYTVGQDPVLDKNLVEWDAIASLAHASMLSLSPLEPPLFSEEDVSAIREGLLSVIRASRAGKFEITNEDQDCHLAIERNLTSLLGDLGKKIHTGRSRNDQSATAIRLYARDSLIKTAKEAVALAGALVRFAENNKDLPMVGRTHLQPAMPSSVGVWASAYAEELLDTVSHVVMGAIDYTDRCPLGSAASYGVPIPIDRELASNLLAFAEPIHNVMAAGNSRGKTESVIVSSLAQIMVTASRFAQDLILFSMPEFGYFSLPREFCTGSSIMPQKYNPDVLELVRSKASQLVAQSMGASSIVVSMAGGYNRDLQDTKKILMESFDATRQTLRILEALVRGIRADGAKLRKAFEEPGVFATDRALELVAKGMPFRDAYHMVRDNLESLRGMDPDEAIAKKRHLGAPCGLDFGFYRGRISAIGENLKAREEKINKAFSALLRAPYPSLEA